MASEKSTTIEVVVLSPITMFPLKRVEPLLVKKKLAPPAPVKQRILPTTFEGPVGMLVTTARLLPLAVQLVAGLGFVR